MPKARRQAAGQSTKAEGTAPLVADRLRRISPKALFWGIIGVLFLVVLVAATWYFTRDLRKESAQLAAITPVEEQTRDNLSGIAELPEAPVTPPAENKGKESDDALSELPAVVPPLVPRPVDDTDNDGLTAAEEDLYKTQSTRPDTDSDGFLDGHETFHLYNPAGVAPERLEETSAVRRFKNESLGYSLLIPTAWQIIASLENPNNIMIQTATGEQIALISIQDNDGRLPLAEWYKSRNFGDTPSLLETNKTGLRGMVSQNKLNGYFGYGSVIYKFEHKEVGENVSYARTFEMMLNSFQVWK